MAKTAAKEKSGKDVVAKREQLVKQRELKATCDLRGHVYLKMHRHKNNKCANCKRRR